MNIDLRLGDCIEVLKTIPDNSVDSIVTDPPYHLTSIVKRFGKEDSAPAQFGTDGAYARASKGFMGKEWDGGDIAFRTDVWNECLRILKPGGHLLAFSHSRTYHRMAVAVEDAGFEIRDQIMWVYGSGFPKSLNIGKAIDKRGGESIGWFGDWLKEWRERNNIPQSKIAELFPSKTGGLTGCVSNWELGNNLPTNEQFNLICQTFDLPFKSLEEAEREFIARSKNFGKQGHIPIGSYGEFDITRGNSEWEGWGTALKPAHEPIVMARKPLSESSIAENVLKHGTGGINIDGSRIETTDNLNGGGYGGNNVGVASYALQDGRKTLPTNKLTKDDYTQPEGRFPANIIFDEEAGKLLDEQAPLTGSAFKAKRKKDVEGGSGASLMRAHKEGEDNGYFDERGGASRFFYCPKTSKKDRNEGLIVEKEKNKRPIGVAFNNEDDLFKQTTGNNHPTVKPTDLMRYLINLVTPKGGTTLDPFMGSGSTGKAAIRCGVNFIGIEKESEYMEIAKARIEHEKNKPVQGKLL
jgi:DNA modification methylase